MAQRLAQRTALLWIMVVTTTLLFIVLLASCISGYPIETTAMLIIIGWLIGAAMTWFWLCRSKFSA